ncbi:ABC transporter permease [Mesorhizobium sp. M7A.F.Ca.US.010.02.1.1]|uniref:ABC transporter permease n=1 Tax=Mesorhizobium sp. M7A.F.Ca.US.010.02.1.1 TaxID=2496743 RepID=UPI000FD57218|nr:ABC transporter permease [Mesorhizobium sp. M7A.F.Ca.US.010.02.1.1]RUW94274.1 ABC transporter permease [Mesorhizobium sp. M7A.F.Ca.US.010.02.1.1]
MALPRTPFLRHPGAVAGALILIAILLMAIFAGILFPGDPWRMVARPNLPPFSPGHLFGTDMLGRDLAAGIAHGAQVTLLIALAVTLLAVAFGTAIGAVAGYFGGWVDDVAMRFTEFVQTIPSFLLTVVIVAIVAPSLASIILAIAIVSWPQIARLVRAEVLSLVNHDFVRAARVGGLSTARIIWGHILPNVLSPVIVAASLMTATVILIESGISFLGLGNREFVSWGYLLGTGRTAFRVNWWLSTIPGLAIFLTVLSLNLVGDGLNHWLNPRNSNRGGRA